MPLRVVVLAELTARDLRTGKSTEARRKIRIDRQSFDEVMAALSLRAFLDVPDRLSDSSKPLIVELEFSNLKSFGPDAVAGQIPGTRDLLKLRAALVDLRSGKVRVADVRNVLSSLETQSAVVQSVRRALEAPPAQAPAPAPEPASTPPAAGDLDALLSMVEAPEGASAETSRGADLTRLDALIRHLVQSEHASERVEGRAVEAAIREIDAALSAQIDEVLHHPEFRRLEATWRSLRFLTDRTDFQQPIRLEVISTGREALLSVYDEVIHAPESQGISQEPLAFVVADQLFDRTPEDVDILRALSERGAHLSMPILASAGSGFLGLSRTGDLAKASQVRDTFSRPEYAKWQGLRQSGPSRWLGLVFNRFLLRAAYAPGERSARSFDYVEGIPGGADDLRLWGNGVWALAALAIRSFVRIGWCTDLMGQRASGMIEDLPVRLFERPGAEQVSFPLETTIADDVERDLSANGLMAITAALNSDRAYLRFAPMAHAPQHYQDATDRARARLQSTLPFQFFVGRLLNFAMLIENAIVPGRGAEEITASYDRALRSLLATAGSVPPDAVKVAVVPNEEDSSRQDLYLKVAWPGFQSLPGAGAVEFRWPLAR
jgi:type VI secretion system protein ImpC